MRYASLLWIVLIVNPFGCAAGRLCGGQEIRASRDAGVRPYDKNPFYWQYRGKPLLLFGGSNRDNLFQWAHEGSALTDHLDLLQNCGGNYVRCTMSSREYTSKGYRWDILPYPFARADGKYDLTQWNDLYWRKLRTFLAQTHKRGIIVQLELWDRWNESGNSKQPGNGWYDSPWNPNNNSTYAWADSPLLTPGKTDFYNAFHKAAVTNDPVLLPLQQRFIEKILDEIIGGGFDHVLYQIDNESGIGDESLEPDPYWAQYVRDYAMSKGTDAYVCTSRRLHWPSRKFTAFQDWSNPEIRVPVVNPAFNYCDISQNNGHSGQLHYDNIVWFRSKVQEHGIRPINNVKCYYFNWPIGVDFRQRTAATAEEAGAKFWRAVFGGAAGIRFHRRTPFAPAGLREGFGLEADALPHIRSMRMFADAIHIFTTTPSNELLVVPEGMAEPQRSEDEAYCLAEPPKQYAVFFTGQADHRVALDLTAADGAFTVRWLEISNSTWTSQCLIQGGRTYTCQAPGSGLWVAVIQNVLDFSGGTS